MVTAGCRAVHFIQTYLTLPTVTSLTVITGESERGLKSIITFHRVALRQVCRSLVLSYTINLFSRQIVYGTYCFITHSLHVRRLWNYTHLLPYIWKATDWCHSPIKLLTYRLFYGCCGTGGPTLPATPAPGQILTKVFGGKGNILYLSVYLHCFKRIVLTEALLSSLSICPTTVSEFRQTSNAVRECTRVSASSVSFRRLDDQTSTQARKRTSPRNIEELQQSQLFLICYLL